MSELSTAQLSAKLAGLIARSDLGSALATARALVEQAPDLADGWFNLAYLQRHARQFDAALDSYAQALRLGVAGPEEVHVNRAAILSEHLGRDAEAEAALRAALALDRQFLPAWLNLGLLFEDRGDSIGARETYLEAQSFHPANGRIAARLAAIDMAQGYAADAAAALTALDQRPDLTPDDRVEIGFALANALDATGDFDRAFTALDRANRLARGAIPAARRYRPADQDRLVDAIIATFDGSRSIPQQAVVDPPVFICGMFRSGSTLCERLLARHSRVTAGGELETLPAIVRDRLQPYPTAVAGQSDAELAALSALYLDEVRTRFPDAHVLTDKRCDNVMHIGLIKTLFPAARIVHTRRQALDNILSVMFLHFDDNIAYGFAFEDAVHYYKSYRRLMAHWHRLYGADIFDFDYDAVVRDPAPVMRDLLAFCHLDAEPDCIAGRPADGMVRTASAWQVRQPLYDRSSGRWRHYADKLRPVIDALGDD